MERGQQGPEEGVPPAPVFEPGPPIAPELATGSGALALQIHALSLQAAQLVEPAEALAQLQKEAFAAIQPGSPRTPPPTLQLEPEPEPEPEPQLEPEPDTSIVWTHGFVASVYGSLRAYIHPLAAVGSGPGHDVICYRRNWGDALLSEGSSVRFVASPSLDDPDQLVATQVVVTKFAMPTEPLVTWSAEQVAMWVGQVVQDIDHADEVVKPGFVASAIDGGILSRLGRPLLMQLLLLWQRDTRHSTITGSTAEPPAPTAVAAACGERLLAARDRVLSDERRQRLNGHSFRLGTSILATLPS